MTTVQITNFKTSFGELKEKYLAISESARMELLRLDKEYQLELQKLHNDIFGENHSPFIIAEELVSPLNPFAEQNIFGDDEFSEEPAYGDFYIDDDLQKRIDETKLTTDELYKICIATPKVFDIAHNIYKAAKAIGLEIERMDPPSDSFEMCLIFFINDHFLNVDIKSDGAISVKYEIGIGTDYIDRGTHENVTEQDIIGIFAMMEMESNSACQKLTPEQLLHINDSYKNSVLECTSIEVKVVNKHGAHVGITIPNPTQDERERVLSLLKE